MAQENVEGADELVVEPIIEGEIIEEDAAVSLVSEASSDQDQQASVYAVFFLKKLVRLRGVRISREGFLRQELRKLHLSDAQIERAIASDPVSAGISRKLLDKLASDAISFETKKSTALSFAAGIPGGLAMLGTVPADLTQYYVHSLRIMQKLAYLYGWRESSWRTWMTLMTRPSPRWASSSASCWELQELRSH